MTLLYSDSLFLKHDTGRHPETLERLRAIAGRLEKTGLAKMCTPGSFEPLSEEAVSRVHPRPQIHRIRQIAEAGGGFLDGDTILSADSYRVALAAAGACVAAVDAVLSSKSPGGDLNALCLVRPPGHHATPRPIRSAGFCLFNNVALAARRAIDHHRLERVLIVDFDVHHGNGTQDIFWDDPNVVFFSIHRHGMGFYPGTGSDDETGTGRGLGHIFNAPIRYGTPRQEYLACYTRILEKAADRIKPELVLVSAGFDAHARDPVGSLGLEVEDFVALTRLLLDVARTHARGRLVSCLEGGYHLEMLAESVHAHLEELLGAGSSTGK
jgi:acetoin utilization deacetylase AcuC-like enzyme